MADPASEREPCDSRRGDDPERSGKAEDMRGVVDIADEGTAEHMSETLVRVDVHTTHRGEVDHETIVDTARDPAPL